MGQTRILVVGDWLVDEYWLLGEQRSSFSRRRGLRHTLALHSADASIRTLGGAGMVASVLGQMIDASSAGTHPKPLLEVTGIGRWHPDDKDAILHLLWSALNRQQTHHRLTVPADGSIPDNVSIYNLACGPSEQNQSCGTTRVIRLYRRVGSHIELVRRIDWEVETTGLLKETEPNIPNPNRNREVKHIAVLDLCKGVVTAPLIKALRKRFPKLENWYIFSKEYKPKWLKELSDVRDQIRILFMSQTAATQAMSRASGTSPGWLTPSREQPSQDAVRVLQELRQEYSSANIVVMPRGLSLLLSLPREEQTAYVQPDYDLPKYGDLIPMSTVMFPTLIGHHIVAHNSGKGARPTYDKLVERALAFTNHWMISESDRFRQDTFFPSPRQVCRIGKNHTEYCGETLCERVPAFRELKRISLTDASKQWEQAFTNFGIVERKDRPPVFQLWRAMTNIRDYAACIPYKRRILQQLVGIGRDFKAQHERRHTSVLLIDNPGAGKSYLVECLARELPMPRLEFNITQLLSRADLLHCFDTIVTTQAQGANDPLLVFFDEINANLDGSHVYDTFLAPLEEGVYVRSGNRFHIQPCLWVFAGTQDPRHAEIGTNHDRSDKMSDFVSRLSYQPFDLSKSQIVDAHDTTRKGELGDLERLERIYVAIAALQAELGDVTQVSEGVFHVFAHLKDGMGPRAIRQFVRRFQDVQRGRVTLGNLPRDYRAFCDPEPKEDGKFVDIRFEETPDV